MVSFGDEMDKMACAVEIGNTERICFRSPAAGVAENEKQSDIAVEQCSALFLKVIGMDSVGGCDILSPTGSRRLEQLDKLLVWKPGDFGAFPSFGLHAANHVLPVHVRQSSRKMGGCRPFVALPVKGFSVHLCDISCYSVQQLNDMIDPSSASIV